MSTTDIQQQLLRVLNDLKGVLRDADHREALEETLAGEEGLALEVICQQLYEYQSQISDSIYEQLRSIGMALRMSPKSWEILRTLIRR